MVMLAAPSVPCKWINTLCNHCWRVISLKRAGPIFCYTETTPTLTVFQIHSRWQNRRLDLFPFDPSFGCIDRHCCWWNIIPYHEASSFSCGHSSMDSHPASILCWQNVVPVTVEFNTGIGPTSGILLIQEFAHIAQFIYIYIPKKNHQPPMLVWFWSTVFGLGQPYYLRVNMFLL